MTCRTAIFELAVSLALFCHAPKGLAQEYRV